jgi:hypothetical protein
VTIANADRGATSSTLFQLVLNEIHIVEKEQGLNILEPRANLGFGRFADVAGLVEGLEDALP